jgi:tRNA nucleotidyltransferase (CCA-adding enzyme)
MKIDLPTDVVYIIETLQRHGHEAYAVGGCIRDTILGIEPQDWDICTSAQPMASAQIFANHTIIYTGARHGTLGIVIRRKRYDITTFRIDGTYSDHRSPDGVSFTHDLHEDLRRRDFTINAMAYNEQAGLIDRHGGMADLADKQIRCIGVAQERLTEDALRIMRALRFATTLGFEIECQTALAMIENKLLLQKISIERIAMELKKLIMGDDVSSIVLRFFDVFAIFIPELIAIKDIKFISHRHRYDILTYTLKSIDIAKKDLIVRLSLLFHDIAIPECTTGEDGSVQYRGHETRSAEISATVLKRLKFDTKTTLAVSEMVKLHNIGINTSPAFLSNFLKKFGVDKASRIMELKQADLMTHPQPRIDKILPTHQKIFAFLDEARKTDKCVSIKDLRVNGNCLIKLGYPRGKEIGKILNYLHKQVMRGKVKNDRDELLEHISKRPRIYSSGT